VSLIPRIYDADSGSVLIDGHPIRELPLGGFAAQYRLRSAGDIPVQRHHSREHCLRRRSMRATKTSAAPPRPPASPPKSRAFLTVTKRWWASADLTLSGGQKQRTAIARALIRNPRILVLDDALASVDTQTEDHILNHLREIMQGRTTIFISHRVSTVRNADRIAVLHDGEIVEQGTHDELIERNGYYTELYNKQLLEEELETV
jgi:ATP-binding cassette subfamily B multidrug efflux pump